MFNTCDFCYKSVKLFDCVRMHYDFRRQLVEMLHVLLLNSATLQCDGFVCKWCIEKITNTATFKQDCSEKEKSLPIVRSNEEKINLKKFLQKEGILQEKLEDAKLKICRLCWIVADDNNNWMPLTELLEKENLSTVFQEHIPEIKLQAVEHSMICATCQKHLSNFKDLVTSVNSLNTAHDDHMNISPEDLEPRKTTEVYVKEERGSETETIEEKPQEQITGKSERGATVKEEDSENKYIMKVEVVKEEKEDVEELEIEVKIEPPESVSWAGEQPSQLKPEEIIMDSEDFKSDRVTAQSTDYENERRERTQETDELHETKESSNTPKRAGSPGCKLSFEHKAKSKVDLHKCNKCSYAAKRTDDLKRHMLVHKSKSEVDLHMCKNCSHATKRADDLKRHMLIHKSKSEVDLHKCTNCSFTTKYANSLRGHMLVHKTVSEVDLHKCNECSYAAKRANDLKKHTLVHKSKSEVDLHMCKNCSFATKRAGHLKQHMLTHLSKSEVNLYKCQKCSYAAKQARYLKKHMLVHKAKS